MPWSMSTWTWHSLGKKIKYIALNENWKKTIRIFVFQKYGKFWRVLLGHFIKHDKPQICEEWHRLFLKYIKLQISALFNYRQVHEKMDLVLKRRLPYWMKTFEEIFEDEGEKRKLSNLNWVFSTFCWNRRLFHSTKIFWFLVVLDWYRMLWCETKVSFQKNKIEKNVINMLLGVF